MPVGFKNATWGGMNVVVNALKAAVAEQTFFGISPEGVASMVSTKGNPNCHTVLRGGDDGPNYDADAIHSAIGDLQKGGVSEAIVVDASHANCSKDFEKMPSVFEDVVAQRVAGNTSIVGAMLESNLVEGKSEDSRRPFRHEVGAVSDGPVHQLGSDRADSARSCGENSESLQVSAHRSRYRCCRLLALHPSDAKTRFPILQNGWSLKHATFCFFLSLFVGFANALIAADRPNVVWIVSEDNSKHYLKLFDNAGAETPNIAALAESGVLFTRAFFQFSGLLGCENDTSDRMSCPEDRNAVSSTFGVGEFAGGSEDVHVVSQ